MGVIQLITHCPVNTKLRAFSMNKKQLNSLDEELNVQTFCPVISPKARPPATEVLYIIILRMHTPHDFCMGNPTALFLPRARVNSSCNLCQEYEMKRAFHLNISPPRNMRFLFYICASLPGIFNTQIRRRNTAKR